MHCRELLVWLAGKTLSWVPLVKCCRKHNQSRPRHAVMQQRHDGDRPTCPLNGRMTTAEYVTSKVAMPVPSCRILPAPMSSTDVTLMM